MSFIAQLFRLLTSFSMNVHLHLITSTAFEEEVDKWITEVWDVEIALYAGQNLNATCISPVVRKGR